MRYKQMMTRFSVRFVFGTVAVVCAAGGCSQGASELNTAQPSGDGPASPAEAEAQVPSPQVREPGTATGAGGDTELPATADPSTSEVDEDEAAPRWAVVEQALDGMDTVAVADLDPQPLEPERLAGRYRCEQGGSILGLHIRRARGRLVVTRQHREPGAPPHRKVYRFPLTPVEATDATASESGDAFVRRTREGVILLELSSGTDVIPSSYWTHYISR